MASQIANSLSKTQANIGASLRALENAKPSSSSGAVPPLPAGLGDIVSTLLQQLRQTVTMLALAFKPPLTPSAIEPQLPKIEDSVGRLISCVLAAAAGDPGAGHNGSGPSALVDGWKVGVERVGEEVQRMLATLRADVMSGVAEERDGEDAYLSNTGMVWGVIDGMLDGLPRSEGQAVARRWEGQKETVRDAWGEFKEMLEDADEDDEEDAFVDEDDEWAELEQAMGGKMSAAERERAEAAKPVLGLHQILHATIPRHLPLLAKSPEETYAPLLKAGEGVVAALDTAVSTLYPKQDAAEIFSSMDALNCAGRELAETFGERLRENADKGKIAVAESFTSRWLAKLDEEEKKWQEKRLSLASLGEALE